jgi:hypothetical protein
MVVDWFTWGVVTWPLIGSAGVVTWPLIGWSSSDVDCHCCTTNSNDIFVSLPVKCNVVIDWFTVKSNVNFDWLR